MFDFLKPPKTGSQTKADPEKDARDRILRAQKSAARDVISAAKDAAKKVKPPKDAITLAFVKQAEEFTSQGKQIEAIAALKKGLGDVWARKLRTATMARVPRKSRKDQEPIPFDGMIVETPPRQPRTRAPKPAGGAS